MAHFGLTNRDERTAQTRLHRSGLRVSGFDHDGAPHRASVSIEMLALLVEWVAERVCGDTRRNIHIRLGRIRLAKWLCGGKTIWQVTRAFQCQVAMA